jgi:TRAP-type transport system periplasmic protein
MVKSLGMAPVSLPPGDIYVALQRGTLDGTISSWTTFPVYKLQEVTKYHVELPLGGSVLMAVMSKKKYDALPEAARKAIDANAIESFSRAYGKVLGEDAEKGKKLSAGHEIVRLDAARTADWRKKFGDGMIDGYKKSNPQAEKVLEVFLKNYADVKAGR